VTWAFDNIKDSMEEIYDASGYGWDDEDKLAQLTEPEALYIYPIAALTCFLLQFSLPTFPCSFVVMRATSWKARTSAFSWPFVTIVFIDAT